MSGRALLKIPTMPSEAFAVISPKQDSSSSQESCLLVRNAPLGMEAWVASSTGREHARLGMVCLHALEASAAAGAANLHPLAAYCALCHVHTLGISLPSLLSLEE